MIDPRLAEVLYIAALFLAVLVVAVAGLSLVVWGAVRLGWIEVHE